MPEQELVNIIKWRDDPASQKVVQRIQQLLERAERLRKQLEQLRAQTATLSRGWRDLDSAGQSMPRTLATQSASALKAERQLLRLKAAVKEAGDAIEDTDRKARNSDGLDAYDQRIREAAQNADIYGDVSSRTASIGQIGGAIGGAGTQQQFMLAADLFDAVEASKRLRAEVPKLIAQWGLAGSELAALGAAGVATAAAMVAVKGALKQLEEGSKRVQDAAEANMDSAERYHQFIQDATRESLIDEVESTNQRLAANRAFYEDLILLEQRAQEALDQGRGLNAAGIAEGVLQLYDALGGDPASIDKIRERRKELEQTLTADERYTSRLVEALMSGATAANDAAEQHEEATSRRISALEREAAAQVDTANQIANSSSETIQARLDAIEAEQAATDNLIAGLEPLAGDSEEAATKLNEARDKLWILNEETERLTGIILPAVQAREREADAIERLNQLSKDRRAALAAEAAAHEQAIREIERAKQITASFMETGAETAAKRALQAQRDEEDFERQRARDIANHYAGLAAIDAKYYDDVAKTLQSLAEETAGFDQQKVKELANQNKEMQRLAKDHNKRMLQIARDLDSNQQEAVEDRDVSAAIRAARQAQDQARDENEQYEDERERREDDFEERLKELDEQRAEKQKRGRQALQDLQMQHQKERQAQIAAFNAARTLEDQERRIKLQRQQEDYRNEDTLRLTHYANQISQYSQHFQNVQTTTQTGLSNVQKAVQAAWNAIAGSIASTPLTVSGSSTVGYVSGTGRAKPYGTGGKILPDQWVMLGDTGAELAKFHRDGSWEALNPRQTQQALNQPGLALSVPVQIYDASNPAMIEAIFEQRVIPKLIQAARQFPVRGAR